jgi:hypothetical protein
MEARNCFETLYMHRCQWIRSIFLIFEFKLEIGESD